MDTNRKWSELKTGVKKTDGQTIKGHEFQWLSDSHECLQFGPVAATFTTTGPSYVIIFHRHVTAHGAFAVDHPDFQKQWTLEITDAGLWQPQDVPELHGTFTAPELTKKIVDRLTTFCWDYEKACTPN